MRKDTGHIQLSGKRSGSSIRLAFVTIFTIFPWPKRRQLRNETIVLLAIRHIQHLSLILETLLTLTHAQIVAFHTLSTAYTPWSWTRACDPNFCCF